MVEELYRESGDAEPETDQFTTHVEGEQNMELGRMTGMLAERDADRAG